MEALISAFLGEIVSRSITVVVEKCREQTTADDDLQRLGQLLLRISAVIEEAEGRCVTNLVMIHQVSMMREQMFRGYYLLDSIKCTKKKTDDEEVSRSYFALSKFNPAKRFRRLSSITQIGRDYSKELKKVILFLESKVSDMKEFIKFLMTYPRLCRQPYGAYLYLDMYMFGRQMEREQAISFLLQAEPNGNMGVLPIVGPGLVGKSTFVEHVCDDERVRNYFSLILFYSKGDLKDETIMTFRDNCVIKHQNKASDEERLLVVIELSGGVDQGAWKRLLHSSERYMTHGSKIIITSRSEKMAIFGTTKAIKLNYLSKEAYWYFFKMLVFGSTDPEEHPKLTSIAMELSLEMRGSFMSAYHVAAILRENSNAQFWCEFLRYAREHTQNNISLLGEYPADEGQPRYAWRWGMSFKVIVRRCDNQKGPPAHGEVPRISPADLHSGSRSAMPRKFEVLCWRSLIPPYYTYVYDCEFGRIENTTP